MIQQMLSVATEVINYLVQIFFFFFNAKRTMRHLGYITLVRYGIATGSGLGRHKTYNKSARSAHAHKSMNLRAAHLSTTLEW